MSAESICIAQVLAPNPAYHSLLVQFRSAQIPTQPVRMLYNGPSDPLSIAQGEMPKAGTWGLVAFVNGDIRNGIWIGSINGDWRDPIMAGTLSGDDCAVADDPKMAYLKYEAQWTGFWNYSGWDQPTQQHKTAQQWPDSSSFVVGVDVDVPILYRQDVDDGQHRIQLEYPMTDRVDTPPDLPFELQYTHGAGTQVSVDSGGNLFVFGATDTDLLDRALAEPAALDVVFAGTTFAIGGGDPANVGSDLPIVPVATPGDMNMIGNMTPVASWTTSFAGATIQIDHSGNISLDSPGTISLTALTINLAGTTITVDSSGVVTISSAGDAATVIDGRNFVLHEHIGVTSGTSITGPIV